MSTYRSDNLIHAQLMSLKNIGFNLYLVGNSNQVISAKVYKGPRESGPDLALKRFRFSTNDVGFVVSSGILIQALVVERINGERIAEFDMGYTPSSNGILHISGIDIELPTVSPVV